MPTNLPPRRVARPSSKPQPGSNFRQFAARGARPAGSMGPRLLALVAAGVIASSAAWFGASAMGLTSSNPSRIGASVTTAQFVDAVAQESSASGYSARTMVPILTGLSGAIKSFGGDQQPGQYGLLATQWSQLVNTYGPRQHIKRAVQTRELQNDADLETRLVAARLGEELWEYHRLTGRSPRPAEAFLIHALGGEGAAKAWRIVSTDPTAALGHRLALGDIGGWPEAVFKDKHGWRSAREVYDLLGERMARYSIPGPVAADTSLDEEAAAPRP